MRHPLVDNDYILRRLEWRGTADKKDAIASVRLLAHVLAGPGDGPFELLSSSLKLEAIAVVNALHDGGLLMKTLERTLYWHFNKPRHDNDFRVKLLRDELASRERVQLRQRG
jgi:hypothetical protein